MWFYVYFNAIGWTSYANIGCVTFFELIYEFYAKFCSDINVFRIFETPNVIHFRLLENTFSMSILNFNIAIGFVNPDDDQIDSYHTTLLEIPSDFDADSAYSVLTHSLYHTYNSKTSKALPMHELP